LKEAYKTLSDQLFQKQNADKSVNNIGTVGEVSEWFMLAMSSYKMKKYGECLFAVSKTQKRSIASNAVVININNETDPAENSSPTESEQTYFDVEGNLNLRGKAFVGYLKAKCLCKMKRYSESLFTLARITGSTLDLA